MRSSNVSEQAHRHAISLSRLSHNEVTEESSDGTTIGHNLDTRILDTIAFPTVSTVAFLGSFPQ